MKIKCYLVAAVVFIASQQVTTQLQGIGVSLGGPQWTVCSKGCDYGWQECVGSCTGDNENVRTCNEDNCPEKEGEKNHGAIIILKHVPILKAVLIEQHMMNLTKEILQDYCKEKPTECCHSVDLGTPEDEAPDNFFSDVEVEVANSYPRVFDPDVHVKMLAEIDVTTVAAVCEPDTRRNRKPSADMRMLDKDLLKAALSEHSYRFSEKYLIEIEVADIIEEDKNKSNLLKIVVAPVSVIGGILLFAVVPLVALLLSRQIKAKRPHEYAEKMVTDADTGHIGPAGLIHNEYSVKPQTGDVFFEDSDQPEEAPRANSPSVPLATREAALKTNRSSETPRAAVTDIRYSGFSGVPRNTRETEDVPSQTFDNRPTTRGMAGTRPTSDTRSPARQNAYRSPTRRDDYGDEPQSETWKNQFIPVRY